MNYWLLKSEPDVFGIDDLARAPRRTTGWEGVRNYQARAAERLRAIESPAQRAIVETRAHAEAVTARVERDERHEHGVERQQRGAAAAGGLVDAEPVAAHGCARPQGHERHFVGVAAANARHEELHALCPGIGESQPQVDFAGQPEVDADATPASPEAEAPQLTPDGALRGLALAGGQAAAQRAEVPPRFAGRKGRGATRLCRHRPLLSTWSNIWGRPRHLRLSARGGLAQCCRLARLPRVFTLRSRGNPDRVEHRRRRQVIEGSDCAAPS